MSDSSSNLFPVSAGSSTKLLVLDEAACLPKVWLDQFRSLHIEHVSLGSLVSQEICRRSSLGQSAERAMRHGTLVPAEINLALLRRWFTARKPDAGFLLQGFPATLLQARILDEWLESRDENLDAVLALTSATARGELADYYRIHGLLVENEMPVALASRP